MISRRAFLQTAAGGGASFLLLPYSGCKLSETPVEGAFLTLEQRQAARVLADQILPADETAGAADLGAVDYIEQLLTAFDHNPPRIYASGPSSGRKPFTTLFPGEASEVENSFKNYVPLTRVQEAAWRLRLFGAEGVVGLRELIPQGLNKAIKLGPGAQDLILRIFNGEFWRVFSELVIESSFAAPEYGGNHELLGWKLAHFEGDVQPWGYTRFDESSGRYLERPEAPVSTANPGSDPDPLSGEVKLLLGGIALIEGKIFKLKKDDGSQERLDVSEIQDAAMRVRK